MRTTINIDDHLLKKASRLTGIKEKTSLVRLGLESLIALESRINFEINDFSIITDMWLEIDGELKRAETLSRQTGERIYNRIVRRRIDPALLTKRGNGSYSLRVFPVNSKQKRRVIIEYYSILETNDYNFPMWIFNTRDTKVNITIKGSLPENSHIYINGEYVNLQTKNKFSLTTPTQILFNFLKDKKPVRFYKNNIALWQFTQKTKELKKLNNIGNIPAFLETVIEHIKNKENIIMKKGNDNVFLNSFCRYLIKKYNIPTFYHDDAWNWAYYKDQLTYLDQNIILNTQAPSEGDYQDLYCPYLNIFYDYLFGLNKEIDEQKKLGFLTRDLSKIVLEEDERALQIRESELKLEKERNKISKSDIELQIQPSSPETDTDDLADVFIAYDEAPQPVEGFAAIQKNLIYPGFAVRQELKGRVVVNCLIDEHGQIARTNIIKSLHPVLDLFAIDALKSVEWKPAKQRDKPVKVWIGIPVVFDYDRIDKDQIRGDGEKVLKIQSRISDRYFDIEASDRTFFYETGFDRANNKKIKINTEPFFDFLFDYPELIEIVYGTMYQYNVDGLGLIHDGQSIYFESE